MKKGDLVREKCNRELGIILSIRWGQVWIFKGNGKKIKDERINWELVPFFPEVSIPANFVELVDKYLAEK